MNLSRKRARAVLSALMLRGGSATTAELRDAMSKRGLTSNSVATDVSHARHYARSVMGIDGEEPIACTYEGQSESGAKVYRYTLHAEVKAAWRRAVAEAVAGHVHVRQTALC